MKIDRLLFSAFLFLVVFAGNAFGERFQSFSAESKRATTDLNCLDADVTPAEYGMGALYGCIQGSAQTVKWFINEIPSTDRVENVKLMWNDWFKDTGHGLHADRHEAQKAVEVLAKLYGPQKRKELKEAFFGKKDRMITSNGFVFKYTYSRGPAIDEHLIVVTQK